MARRPQSDPRVTDLRRYRRERERASRAARKPPPTNEPMLGRNRKGAVFVVLVIAVLAALSWLSGHHF